MIASFGDFQVGIVFGCELDAGRRHQIDKWVVWLRQVRVHVLHHFILGMRSGDGEHLWMNLLDEIATALTRLGAEAAGDDHPAVFGQRLADRIERFLHRGIDESAGIHHHQVGAGVVGRDLVALGAQLRDDLLGIHQRLGATQRNKADFRRLCLAFADLDRTADG